MAEPAAAADEWVPVSQMQPPAPADEWRPVGETEGAPAAPPPLSFFGGRLTMPLGGHQLEPIMQAFGRGFEEGWGPERLGVSDADVKRLSDAKIFGPAKGGYDNPMQAAAELLANSILGAGQIAFRTAGGIFRGGQEAVSEIGAQLGEPALGRELAAVPEAFMGSPHPMGIPKGMPPGAVVLREVPTASRIVATAEGAPKFIDAYHGSPHDFGAFSTEHIGTGEGAQVYGHGLYFAERPQTAEAYQKKLAPRLESQPLPPEVTSALKEMDYLGFDNASQAIKAIRADQRDGANWRSRWDVGPEDAKAADVIDQHIHETRPLPPSYLYRVRINADPEHFLDWDKPLSEQSEHVQDVLRPIAERYKAGSRILAELDIGTLTGENLLRAIREGLGAKRPQHTTIDAAMAATPGGAEVSRVLSEAGIPGIKYLDQGSRAAGEGSRNFVVFDDSSLEITHRNGQPVGPADFPDPNALPPTVAEARELGVIGPPKPDLSQMAPAERAAAEVPVAQAAARTGDDVLRGPAPGEPPKAGNIRLDQIGINADAKDVILEAAKSNDDFNQARAGNVPLAQVETLSSASGVPSAALTANEGLGRLMHNDAVVRTWLQAFHQASNEIAEQLAKVKNTGAEEDIAKLREMKLRFQHMQEQVSGLTAEAGRTLAVFREFYENKGKAEMLGKLLEDNPGNDAGSLKKLADAAGALDPSQLPKFLHDANKPNWWDKYLYYWVNALISGPTTHIKYIGANAAFGAYEAGVVTPIAGALGTARRALGGTEGVYAGEAAARTYGLLAGTPDALRAAWTAAKNNVMTPFPNEVAGKAVNPLTQVRPSVIGGRLGFAIGIPGRSAAGIHSFFRWLGYRAEIEAQAYRNAAKEGLSPTDGEAFWQRYAYHAANPSEAALNAGIENGNHLTFIGEQGAFGQATSRFANTRMGGPNGIQPFKLILPFTHIPGQILRAGLEQTPFAFLDTKMRADIMGRNGAVAADTARARLIAGGVVSAMVANWAINDSITGYGPTEQSERARWLRTHEPYSVRLGGWWVSYNKFGPIGDLVGLVANLIDVGPKVKEGEYAEAAGHVLFATSRILEDEVGMQGLVNLIEALNDKEGRGLMGRLVAQQAASNMPYSSLLRQVGSGGIPFTGGALGDPYMREAKNFVDQLRYNVPFARQDLLPKRDWLGQPMTNPGYGNILRSRAVNEDPIDLEVSQLRGFKPGPPLARINGVALPPKIYDEYQAIAGGMTRALLENLVTAPGWGNIPPGTRENTLHKGIESMRQTAGSIIQARHPEVWQQGVRDKIDKIRGDKPTKLKD